VPQSAPISGSRSAWLTRLALGFAWLFPLLFTCVAIPQGPANNAQFDQARATTNRILAQPEFKTVTDPSEVQREFARIAQWIDDLFNRVATAGRHNPWLLPLLEWGFFALAVAALLAWGFRVLQRQRLAIAVGPAALAVAHIQESEDWADLARSQAAEQAWRDAVHSLYWATIVMLEGRKFWRPNRARTPREYLRLLEDGSPRQQSLRGLTRIFERIWYGQRPASESDYTRVLALFDELRLA
jgi:Domain of unknown function (DUF4129)